MPALVAMTTETVAPGATGRPGAEREPPSLRLGPALPDGHLGALEDAFRRSRLPGDVVLTRRLLLAWAALMAALLLFQFSFLRERPGFDLVRILNLGNLLITLGTAAWIGRLREPAGFDRVLAAWFATMVLLLLTGLQFSGPRVAHGMALLVLAGIALLLPISFPGRIVPAAVLLAGCAWNGFEATRMDPTLASTWVRNVFVLILGFAIALIVSTRDQRDRRRGFLEERARLAAAARAAELGRLLPVCAYCRQVRRDDGFWEVASAYLARRGIVRGRQGLCERCAAAVPSAPEPPGSSAAAVPDASAAEADDDEATFRQACLPADRVQFAALLAGVGAFFVLSALRFAIDDGAVWSTPAQWGRILFVVVTAGLVPVTLRLEDARHYETLAFGFLLAAVGLGCLVQLLAPNPSALMPILAVLMAHTLLRLPRWKRLVPTVVLSVVAVFAIVDSTREAGVFSVYTLLALVFANVVGVWASEVRDADRWARFRSLREGERAILRAEQLGLLLPTCAGCGQVRDDEGYWTDVF
ncbi:MAG: hypothetical protein V2J02_13805, partial [Pseudomonadales bacterium]|nr:hypothetical protein [Pseudomonadales bacterium]